MQSSGDSPQPCPASAYCPAGSSDPEFCNTLLKPNKIKMTCEVTSSFIVVMSVIGIGKFY